MIPTGLRRGKRPLRWARGVTEDHVQYAWRPGTQVDNSLFRTEQITGGCSSRFIGGLDNQVFSLKERVTLVSVDRTVKSRPLHGSNSHFGRKGTTRSRERGQSCPLEPGVLVPGGQDCPRSRPKELLAARVAPGGSLNHWPIDDEAALSGTQPESHERHAAPLRRHSGL